MIKRYNIVTSRTYVKNGEEKKAWLQVGSLVKFDATQEMPEGFKIELNMFPLTTFHVFEQKDRDAPQSSRTDAEPTHDVDADTGEIRRAMPPKQEKLPPKAGGPDSIDYPTETINPDDIPF